MRDDDKEVIEPEAGTSQPETDASHAQEEAPDGPGVDEVEAAGEADDRPSLVLIRGGKETQEIFAFSVPATIGRFDPEFGPIEVDLGSIDEAAYISRKHARIEAAEDGYQITDLGSSNGTFVLRSDFEKITEPAALADGDEIALGNARFRFRAPRPSDDES